MNLVPPVTCPAFAYIDPKGFRMEKPAKRRAHAWLHKQKRAPMPNTRCNRKCGVVKRKSPRRMGEGFLLVNWLA